MFGIAIHAPFSNRRSHIGRVHCLFEAVLKEVEQTEEDEADDEFEEKWFGWKSPAVPPLILTTKASIFRKMATLLLLLLLALEGEGVAGAESEALKGSVGEAFTPFGMVGFGREMLPF